MDPLLEREAALASLAEYAEEARAGQGRLVLVAGEAGVGKSTFVERVADDLAHARRSWGACDGLFTPRPLGPLFDIADQVGGELLALSRGQAGRYELFAALLRQLGDPGVLDVLVIEDAHWADEATIDLIAFLGRRLRDLPALVLVTFRDDGLAANAPLRLALGDLARQRSTRRVRLAPLSLTAVGTIAAGSGLEPDELFRLTGGNPFFVTEVVQSGMGSVPESARDAVLARAARLGDDARAVLEVAALVGTRTEPRLLEAVHPGAGVALDELVASGLLVAEGSWLRFRHEIARRAVELTIAAHRQPALHARILAALDGADDAAMAFHAEGAGDAAAALHYARRAARHAADLDSHREAAAQCARALRFASTDDTTLIAELHQAYALQLSLVDRWKPAAQEYERALEGWRAVGDAARTADTLRLLSRAMWRLCRGDESDAASEAAVAVAEALGPSVELAWAYANLASQRVLRGLPVEAIELAHRAREMAGPLGLTDVLSDAFNSEGCALGTLGRDWDGALGRSLEIALATGSSGAAGRAYSNIYELHVRERRYAEAERYHGDGLRYCEERDLRTFATCLLGQRTIALERTGRWDEVVSAAEQILARAASPINRINSLISLSKVLVRRGLDGAWDLLDEAATSADGSGESEWIVPVRVARAEGHWLAGRPDDARHELTLAAAVSALADPWQRGELAAWQRRLEATPQADDGGPIAPVYRLQADGAWAEAAARWSELGCPYEAALALFDAGEEEPLRRALSILTDLGATAAVRLVRQRMRRLGLRSIPKGVNAATREDPLRLTRREREVLDLICAGQTNAEIATRLVLSVKTVDHHVSAVLAKLGAPTRHAAAARAARLGLAAKTG